MPRKSHLRKSHLRKSHKGGYEENNMDYVTPPQSPNRVVVPPELNRDIPQPPQQPVLQRENAVLDEEEENLAPPNIERRLEMNNENQNILGNVGNLVNNAGNALANLFGGPNNNQQGGKLRKRKMTKKSRKSKKVARKSRKMTKKSRKSKKVARKSRK
jgi:hypothetical protein